jgi:hypothetical protein
MGDTGHNSKEEQAQAVDISAVDTYTLLGFFINLLSIQAWRDMGLQMDPKTSEIKTDFERASVAIDSIGFLISKLEPKLDPSERPKLKNLLSDLQINFVQQSSQQESTDQEQEQ